MKRRSDPPARSIRTTVLAWQFAALLLLGLVAVAGSYSLAVRSFAELRNLELAQVADAVARHGIDGNDEDDDQPGDFLSQVWEADGRLSYASHEPPLPRPVLTGYSDFRLGNTLWHGYTTRYAGQTVLVAREAQARATLLARISLPLLLLLVLLTGFLLGVLGNRVRRALAPLDALRKALDQRHPAALNHVQLAAAPRELLPLLATLNALLDRIGGLLDAQRGFTADAAHELRTPLTAVGLFAQLARHSAHSGDLPATLAHIDAIDSSCRRAGALVEQMLTLARLDNEAPPQCAALDLRALLGEAVAELSVLAEAQGIDLGLSPGESLAVAGDAAELRILVANLVNNALRYTPAGGRVDVTLQATPEGICLWVDDTGPGVPEAELRRVFARFHRLADARTTGSGLGLAIVQRIAERNALQVHLENRVQGGLRALVRWPPQPTAAASAALAAARPA